MIDDRHFPAAHCQERCVGDLGNLPQSPHGTTFVCWLLA